MGRPARRADLRPELLTVAGGGARAAGERPAVDGGRPSRHPGGRSCVRLEPPQVVAARGPLELERLGRPEELEPLESGRERSREERLDEQLRRGEPRRVGLIAALHEVVAAAILERELEGERPAVESEERQAQGPASYRPARESGVEREGRRVRPDGGPARVLPARRLEREPLVEKHREL